jgi:3-isopropylmalate dehydratase small subunit
VTAIVAESYGAIYERNAINAGLPVMNGNLVTTGLQSGEEITLDLRNGVISWQGGEVQAEPFSEVQLAIYERGGLLVK